MKAMKFRVHSPRHSEAIQKKLFELGYGWCFSVTSVDLTDKSHLYTSENGEISYTDNKNNYFEKHEATETTLDDLYREEESQTLADKIEKLEKITKEMFEAIDNLKEGK